VVRTGVPRASDVAAGEAHAGSKGPRSWFFPKKRSRSRTKAPSPRGLASLIFAFDVLRRLILAFWQGYNEIGPNGGEDVGSLRAWLIQWCSASK
jgi:hypothetical protein